MKTFLVIVCLIEAAYLILQRRRINLLESWLGIARARKADLDYYNKMNIKP